MIEQTPGGRIICSKVQNHTRVFNCLPDSNSNFRPAKINSEIISGRIVCAGTAGTAAVDDTQRPLSASDDGPQ